MVWWTVAKIKQLSTARITAWGGAKFLFGTGLGLLLATYLQEYVSVSFWQVSGWVLITVSTVMGLVTIWPIFRE